MKKISAEKLKKYHKQINILKKKIATVSDKLNKKKLKIKKRKSKKFFDKR